jgi:hypothetical protein
MVSNECWLKAQHEERKYHTLNLVDGYKHYGDSYSKYFHFLCIDPLTDHGCVAEIGPADFPALAYMKDVGYSYIVEPMPSDILKTFGISIIKKKAEDLDFTKCEEVWLLNVLQHVQDPGKIVENAKKAKVVRFFEPINYGTDVCHLHNLTLDMFKEWFGDCVKYYHKNDKAVNFHQWECAYGVWHNQQ